MITDNSELLRRYLGEKSEAAFAELVQRNIDLVYSAALRQVNGDAAVAQDVTQAVFTDLARKAPALARHSSITGWLYTSTRYLATKALRGEHRRRAREEKAHAMTTLIQDSDPNPAWEEIRPVLDEVMHELSSADRDAVLMRYFEGRALGEIGVRLGVSENAARMRVDRALDKLREALARRGLTSTAVALGTALAERSVAAAPLGLAARVSGVAFGTGLGVSSILSTLLSSIAGIKTQLLIGGVVIACLFGGYTFLFQRHLREVGMKPTEGVAALNAKPLSPTTTDDSSTNLIVANATSILANNSDRLVLKIVADDSGKPVPGARVASWVWGGNNVKGKTPLQSTRFGVCEVPLSRAAVSKLILVTQVDGFADTRVQWQTDRGETIPETYTVRLARSVHLGGRVVDADDQPVAGAQVGFNNDPGPALEGVGPQTDNFGWPFWITATTDAQGQWSMDRMSEISTRTIYGGASHPEHVGSELVWANRDSIALKQLLDGSHVFRLGRAVLVRGTVQDPDGQPVADANVLVGHVGEGGRREGKTKSDGTFAVSGCKPGDNLLTADAKGFAPATLQVKLATDSEPFLVTLNPGRILRLRVVNGARQPVPNASIWLDTFDHGPIGLADSKRALTQVEFNRKTDQEGRVIWEGAPDQEMSFDISASGYLRVDRVKARPGEREHIITLPSALTISGTVSDASSGQPIPKFRIITGWPQWNPINNETNAQWSTLDRFWLNFEGGKFRNVFEEPVIGGTSNPGFIFKFEADGYAPFVTRAVGPEEAEVRFDVALRAAGSTVVTILLPNGQPAPGTDIGLVSPGSRLDLIPGGFSRANSQSGGSLLLSDQAGQFKLPPDDAVTRVVAAHAEGIADAAVSDLAVDPTLRLQPWGRLEGTYLSGGKGVPNRELVFGYGLNKPGSVSADFQAYRVTTDENGHFAFAKVPPGTHRLVRLVKQQDGRRTIWSHQPLEEVEIRPGETTQVTVGGASYSVTVRLRWPQDLKRDPAWTVNASLHTSVPPPPEDARTNPQALGEWQALPEVKAALRNMRHFALTENAEGVFSVEDIPSGQYTFAVSVFEPAPAPGLLTMHARGDAPVNIPSDPPSGTLDVGEVTLKPAP